MRRLTKRMVRHILSLILAGRLALGASAAGAAAFVVNETNDLADAVVGDGICATNAGTCSLRAAVSEANATADADTISLPAATVRLTTGELTVSQPVTISGSGSTVSRIRGNRQSRLFHVLPSATLALSGLRIDHGKATVGGAIANEGNLQIDDCLIKANTAMQSDGGLGGAIYNTGSLEIGNSLFQTNLAIGGGAGFGGAIYNLAAVSLSNVYFLRNRAAGCGGGFYNKSGDVQIDDSRFERNSVSNSGGAVFLEGGTLKLDHSSLARNRARQIGGGLFTYAATHVSNSTIGRNRAAMGGGLFSRIAVEVTLDYVTIAENRAPNGGGVLNNGVLAMRNSVIADNLPSDCGGDPLLSNGHNLGSDTSCGLAGVGDLNNVDAGLKRTINVSTLRLYYVPVTGSPLLDAADTAACPADDERHTLRPIDGNGDMDPRCDIGSIEVGP